ncbi:hypothetical protein [Streptomyces sp. NPDC050485]|uniref:hypothetical protein n=1 Tax=Streptomyces sp. NPDC050485 TaxID=3365617 RepID=UPI0037958147
MTDKRAETTSRQTLLKTILATVLALTVAGLICVTTWHFGFHDGSIAWLASNSVVKAVLGPPIVAGIAIYLRQRRKNPIPHNSPDEARH